MQYAGPIRHPEAEGCSNINITSRKRRDTRSAHYMYIIVIIAIARFWYASSCDVRILFFNKTNSSNGLCIQGCSYVCQRVLFIEAGKGSDKKRAKRRENVHETLQTILCPPNERYSSCHPAASIYMPYSTCRSEPIRPHYLSTSANNQFS
jgi:hypothetical protein